MRVLFVTPSEVSSGESIAAVHMAEWLQREGCGVHFLASRFARTFVSSRLPNAVTELGSDLVSNQHIWETALHKFKPSHIVFADYPLLALKSGRIPLLDEFWESKLDSCDAEIFTLDHLGYAQRPRILFFGPPHDTIGIERIPATPSRIHLLLPCPLHDPMNSSLRGKTFRYWDNPSESSDPDQVGMRARYVRSAE